MVNQPYDEIDRLKEKRKVLRAGFIKALKHAISVTLFRKKGDSRERP